MKHILKQEKREKQVSTFLTLWDTTVGSVVVYTKMFIVIQQVCTNKTVCQTLHSVFIDVILVNVLYVCFRYSVLKIL